MIEDERQEAIDANADLRLPFYRRRGGGPRGTVQVMVQLDLQRHVWRSLEEMAREQTRDVRRQSAPVPCVACTGTWVKLGSNKIHKMQFY